MIDQSSEILAPDRFFPTNAKIPTSFRTILQGLFFWLAPRILAPDLVFLVGATLFAQDAPLTPLINFCCSYLFVFWSEYRGELGKQKRASPPPLSNSIQNSFETVCGCTQRKSIRTASFEDTG